MKDANRQQRIRQPLTEGKTRCHSCTPSDKSHATKQCTGTAAAAAAAAHILLHPKYLEGSAATTLTAGQGVHSWSRMSPVGLSPGYTQYPTPQLGPHFVLTPTPDVMMRHDLPKLPASGLFATQTPVGQ